MRDKFCGLGEAYAEYFPVGTAIGNVSMSGAAKEVVCKHFTSLTAENGMKFEAVQSREGEFDFSYGDALAAFAQSNHQKLRGHTLVWHGQTPEWVFVDKNGEPASRELALRRMEKHIDTVVRHFSPSVYCWDVVNEAIEDKTDAVLRDSPWLRCIGEDYIGYAFELAHRADPKCVLFYNDYNNEMPEKREKTVCLLRELKVANIPVDGVGIQGHFNIRDEALLDNLKASLDAYAALGLQIQITELDVSMFAFEDHRRDILSPTAEMLERQREVYRQIFALLREYREVVTGVTFWGVSDAQSWKNAFPVMNRLDWPLLFDEHFQPKACFADVIDF